LKELIFDYAVESEANEFLNITPYLFCQFCYAQNSVVEKFDLVREDSPIFVYERWITFPGKVPAVKAREVKGEFTH
jgi:hypothetical protein